MAGLVWITGYKSPTFVSGRVQQNIGDDATLTPYINFFNGGNVGLSNGASLALTDQGYPTGTLTGGNFSFYPNALPSNGGGVEWVLKWTGNVSGGSLNIGSATIISSSGGSYTGGTGGGTTLTGGSGSPVAARFVFTFANFGIGINANNMFWTSGSTFTNFGNYVLCRLSDEAALDAGAIWNPDFITMLENLNPKVLRFMGIATLSGADNLVCQWNAQMAPPSGANGLYNSYRSYVPELWCSFSQSGQALTSSGYTNMPGTWTDGECFQGNLPGTNTAMTVLSVQSSTLNAGCIQLNMNATDVANLTTGQVVNYSGYFYSSGASPTPGLYDITVINSTAIELTTWHNTSLPSLYQPYSSSPGVVNTATMNVGGRGAKIIAQFVQNIFSPLDIAYGNNNLGYFVYNAVQDAVFYGSGKLFTGFSWKLQIALCNLLNVDWWANIHCAIDTPQFTAMAAYAATNLNPGLTCYLEYSNETWNDAFPFEQYGYCWAAAITVGALPMSGQSSEGEASYSGLRTAMLAKVMQAAWSSAGRNPNTLKVLLGHQEVPQSLSGQFNLNKAQGNLLSLSGNAPLSVYTGGVDYSVFPNRPVDICDGITYADYSPFLGSANIASVYPIADTYQTGSQSAALTSFDNLMRASCVSYGGSGNLYQTYEAIAASYDGAGRPAGKTNLIICAYEGGPAMAYPPVSEYVSAGYSTSATVTFNTSSPAVNWTAHGLVNGCLVSFTNSGGALPAQIGSGNQFYVTNATANTFDITSNYFTPAAITLTGVGTGTTTATAAQYSIENVTFAWMNDATLCVPTMAYHYDFYFEQSAHAIFSSNLQLEDQSFGDVAASSGSTPLPSWMLWPGDLYQTPYFQTYYATEQYNNGTLT